MTTSAPPEFGSKNLRLPDDLRGPLLQHLTDLKCHYQNLDWAGECGWGERPAIVVIDVALWWPDPNCFPMGSNVDPIVAATADPCIKVSPTAGAMAPTSHGESGLRWRQGRQLPLTR